MLTQEVREYLRRSVLCWLATSDADGQPNVSPKEVFTAQGDNRLLIADIASPRSVRNIRVNPKVCVSIVDIFVQRGFKLSGRAKVIGRGDPSFDEASGPLEEITRGVFTIRHVIVVSVDSVAPVVAPSYRFVPGTTEASQVEAAMKSYGIRPG